MSATALSVLFFVATAVLLVIADLGRARRFSRYAAFAALATVAAADVLLLSVVPQTGKLWGLSFLTDGRDGIGKAKRQQTEEEGDDDGDAADHGGSGGKGGGRRRTAGGGNSGIAEDVVDSLRNWFKPAPAFAASPTAPGRTLTDCPDCPELVIVPAGEARAALVAAGMAPHGSGEPVRIWPGFAIGRLEVTRAQFASFLSATGQQARACTGEALAQDESGPAAASCLSWDDAVAYVRWLTAKTGHHYRLPSAVEWHYAAAVGSRMENGPRRMAGGAAEMVADCWSEQIALVPVAVRPTVGCQRRTVLDAGVLARDSEPRKAVAMAPGSASALVGLRVVRELD